MVRYRTIVCLPAFSRSRSAADQFALNQFRIADGWQSVRQKFLMMERQIADLDGHELAMHIRRVQQIAHADANSLSCCTSPGVARFLLW